MSWKFVLLILLLALHSSLEIWGPKFPFLGIFDLQLKFYFQILLLLSFKKLRKIITSTFTGLVWGQS